MKFVFISTPTFEPWDWTNPDTQGIGGSETSHIEMAQRLARLGHEVVSFAPIPSDTQNGTKVDPAGVQWFSFETLITQQRESEGYPFMPDGDVYVIYRAPELIDLVPDGAPCWLTCQDVDYNREWQTLTPERIVKLTRLVALCQTQADYFKAKYPQARVSVSSNGIKRELIEAIAQDPPERNPHRLIYASSPDRGMEQLLQIFPRIKEMVPDAELHLYYGFNNIEKVIAYYGEKSAVAMTAARVRALCEQPGVTFHGRMGQPELLREWFKAGLWVHPSNFTETSCITCMDAQACGAIPITSPVWAIAENVQHGVFIEGNVKTALIQARYVLETFRMMVQPELQEEIRAEMMPWARGHFDWDNFATQWAGWATGDQAQMGRDVPNADLEPFLV
jgi:glycosyltransferase involved in cell wall biosynthesis